MAPASVPKPIYVGIHGDVVLLIVVLILLIVGCGYGGYRAGPGWGYYCGGSLSLILTIVMIVLLLRLF